jgi:hypothetical protein
MGSTKALVGVLAAGLLGLSSAAHGKAEITGHPPVGLDVWTVFSCIVPEQAPKCVVPIEVKLGASGECEFKVAQYIEFDSRRTRRIHWQLDSTDPTPGRRFAFGHTTPPVKRGITFTLDVERDFDDDAGSTDSRFGSKLRRAGALSRAKLFHYDINVQWFDGAGSQPQSCTPLGPAIINRN